MNNATPGIAAIIMLTLGGASSGSAAQAKSAPRLAPAAYDTSAQIEAKKTALAYWCYENSSKESPCAGRREYGLKVLKILKRMPPHPITYTMYKDLVTDDENGNFLPDGCLMFGALPNELSRTSSGETEIIIYHWKNQDGSNVIGTYRNGHLVSKAQSGLK